MAPEGEVQPQAEVQADAGAETVDVNALKMQILGEIKPVYEAEVATWKKRYGDESNAWGSKEKELKRQLADLSAQVEAAKLSDDAADWVARKRNTDSEKAEAQEMKAQAERMMLEARAERALASIKSQPWAAKVPADWFEKAKERLLNGQVVVSTELVWEAQALAGAAGTPQPKPDMAPATAGLTRGGGSRTTKDIMDAYIQNPTPENRKAYEAIRG